MEVLGRIVIRVVIVVVGVVIIFVVRVVIRVMIRAIRLFVIRFIIRMMLFVFFHFQYKFAAFGINVLWIKGRVLAFPVFIISSTPSLRVEDIEVVSEAKVEFFVS